MKKLTEKLLKNIADNLNMKLTYGKYRMWHHVPFIGNTAMVVDAIEKGGGYRILPVNAFPAKLTPFYITSAIMNEAHSLGHMDLRRAGKQFTPWTEHVGDYPPGYFTHQVGNDVLITSQRRNA